MKEIYFALENPRSDNDVIDSYNAFKERMDSAPPAEVPYSADVLLKLNNFSILNDISVHDAAVAAQIEDTLAFNKDKDVATKLIKHFIDELNLNISLSEEPYNSGFQESDRCYYGLPSNKATYPKLKSYNNAAKVLKNCINGEKSRINDGGEPLKAVTWQMLLVWHDKMVAKYNKHLNSINNAKDKQITVNEKVYDYINNIYPDMKADAISFFRKLDKVATRLKMTDWGILYKEIIVETEEEIN